MTCLTNNNEQTTLILRAEPSMTKTISHFENMSGETGGVGPEIVKNVNYR